MPGAKKNFIGLEGFIWWIGVVEDRQDPEQLGRVRVRCFGWHTEDKNRIPTNTLPWAHPVIPVNHPATYTPKEGDMVFGFFIDGENAQNPVIVGVLPGKPEAKPNYQNGFSDPRTSFESVPNKPDDAAEAYPKGKYVKEATTSRLARGVTDGTIVSIRKNNLVKSIKSAGGVSWDEPTPPYAAKYPYNNSLETESGHSFELDDSPGAERVQLAHRNGSYIEMDQNGNRIEKIQKDNYEIIMGSDYVYIKGTCSVTIGGDCNLKVVGKVNAEAAEINISATGDVKIKAGGAIKMQSGSTFDVKSGSAVNVESGGNINLKAPLVAASPISTSKLDASTATISTLSAGSTDLKATGTDTGTNGGSTHNLSVAGSGSASVTSAASASESGLSDPDTGSVATIPSRATSVSGSTGAALTGSTGGNAVGKAVAAGQTSSVSNMFNTVNNVSDGAIKDLKSNMPIAEVTNNVRNYQNLVNSERGNILSLVENQKNTILDKIGEVSVLANEKNIPFDLNTDLQKAVNSTKGFTSSVEVKIGRHVYPSTQTFYANTKT